MKAALAALLLTGTAFAAEPKAHKDIPYTDPKTEKQALDVYAPPDDCRIPGPQEPQWASLQGHQPPAEPGIHRTDDPR